MSGRSLEDSGQGIAPEVLPRIFEQFFSTKESRPGMGLAAVEGIVLQHNGWIDVISSGEKGTTFQICLSALNTGVSGLPSRAETAD